MKFWSIIYFSFLVNFVVFNKYSLVLKFRILLNHSSDPHRNLKGAGSCKGRAGQELSKGHFHFALSNYCVRMLITIIRFMNAYLESIMFYRPVKGNACGDN